jgi:3-phenylpropionate/trans-cinnamate dioxygenase ferredoxin subunit
MTDPSDVADVTDVTGWHLVGPASAIAENEATLVAVVPPVAVFHLEDGYFATDDTCTHAESSLAEGIIEDGTVECEFHFAKFCVRTGAALTRPAVIPLATYPVRVLDGTVYVDLSSRDRAPADA